MTPPNNKPEWIFERAEPGVPVIARFNTEGLKTLYLKEVRRFWKVQLQTVWAPAITTLLFLVIFAVALGRGGNAVLGVPYANFLGPGLIVMGMIQNSFANTSSSILVAKMQGSIIDVLMPPLSAGELLLAWVAGALTRAWAVGFAVWVVMALAPGVDVAVQNPLLILYFGTMGSVLLALLGVLTGVWADKFDHAAAVGNFRRRASRRSVRYTRVLIATLGHLARISSIRFFKSVKATANPSPQKLEYARHMLK